MVLNPSLKSLIMSVMLATATSGILNWCELNLPRFTQKHETQKSNLTGLELTARRDVFRESKSLFSGRTSFKISEAV